MLLQQVAPKGITEVQDWQGTLKTSWRKWLPKLQPKLNLQDTGRGRASGQRNTDCPTPTPRGPPWPGGQPPVHSPAVFLWRETLTSWNLILPY